MKTFDIISIHMCTPNSFPSPRNQNPKYNVSAQATYYDKILVGLTFNMRDDLRSTLFNETAIHVTSNALS